MVKIIGKENRQIYYSCQTVEEAQIWLKEYTKSSQNICQSVIILNY